MLKLSNVKVIYKFIILHMKYLGKYPEGFIRSIKTFPKLVSKEKQLCIMNTNRYQIYIILLGLVMSCFTFAQSAIDDTISNDTIISIPGKPDSVLFTPVSASDYISNLLQFDNLWKPGSDTMKVSLERIIEHYNEPFDSVSDRLTHFNYDSLSIQEMTLVKYDTLPVLWLNDSTFIINSPKLERDPFIPIRNIFTRELIISDTIYNDSISETLANNDSIITDSIPEMFEIVDSIVTFQDTLTSISIDSSYLESLHYELFHWADNQIIPPVFETGSKTFATLLPDSLKLLLSDTTNVLAANEASPFYIVPNEGMPDSLKYAISTLLSYTAKRDSILIYVNDIEGNKTPFWISSGKEDLVRYWIKNAKNDSITIWMGNPANKNLSLVLEEEVNVKRLEIEPADGIPITEAIPEIKLAKIKTLKEIPIYWDYDFSSSFSLNQSYLSNWSKGGESSLSSVLEIKGSANYVNKEEKTKWINNGRLKYGNIVTEQNGLRTTTDMLELNSQYNKVLKEKLDFSAVFYMKNQIAKGYKYPNDSIPVSKFLNPLTYTVGVGVEYRPFKNTILNFSPLSNKATIVFDTAHIDQTKHGIAADKKSRLELGGQLVIKNSIDILDGFKISNSIRLFSSYLNKPQNIDVDWEMDLEKQISWYFSIKLNFHTIYDKDILFPVLDENDKPVLLPDGSAQKLPKLQFKEFMGLTLAFSF